MTQQSKQQQAGDQAKPQAGRQQEQENKQRQQQGSGNAASSGSNQNQQGGQANRQPSDNKTDQR